MVEQIKLQLDSVFRALGDPTRRHMLQELASGEKTVTQLARPFEMSLAAASKHVKVLESAGLLHREVKGRIHVCRINAQPLARANDWLRHYEKFWNSRLDALEHLLHLTPNSTPTFSKPKPKRKQK
jgi:DNA-binding transcriptional ArsR family regulator